MNRISRFMGRLRIRTLIYTLISVMAFSLTTIQMVYLFNVRAMNAENTRQYINLSLGQLVEETHAFNSHIDQLGRELAFNVAANAFIASTNAVEWLRNYTPLMAIINSVQIADKSLRRVIYTDFNMLYVGSADHEDFALLFELKELVESADMKEPRHLLIDGQSVFIRASGYNPVLDRQFYLVIFYNKENFTNAIKTVDSMNNQLFTLYNDDGQIIVQESGLPDINPELPDAIKNRTNDGFSHDLGYIIAVRSVPEIEWRWVIATPNSDMNGQLIGFAQFTLILTMTLITLLVLVAALIQQSITQPILYINRFMSEINENYDSRRLSLVQNNEIGELADKLNDMLVKIGAMNREMIKAQQQIYESQLGKQRMELSALYSQINPHFLYNTLDCIRSIAAINGVEPIVSMTSSMAKIFRYSIKSRSFVRMREELDCIFEYMKILQIRYRNGFTEQYDIEQSCYQLFIPKMILQPVVENAVFHGLEQTRKHGELSIKGHTAKGVLHFEIRDNGKGMDGEVLRTLRDSLENATEPAPNDKKSVGLRNIHSRIRLLCGNEYGMDVESTPDAGTCVRLKLPALTDADMEYTGDSELDYCIDSRGNNSKRNS